MGGSPEEGALKKRQLEILLQQLTPFANRSAKLEQYSTPADVAADVLWTAYASGDVEGKSIADLGCGNGILSIGARLLGASRVVGVDVDEGAIEVASSNSLRVGAQVEFVVSDVAEFTGSFDATIQNPPFGAQMKHADRLFIQKSIEISPTVYSLHNEAGLGFITSMTRKLGATCAPVKRYKFEIPYAFEFHRKTSEVVSVVLLKFQR